MDNNHKLWAKRLKEWNESGLSQKNFCNDRRISYSTFHYWRKKLNSKTEQFVELKLNQSTIYLATSAAGITQYHCSVGGVN